MRRVGLWIASCTPCIFSPVTSMASTTLPTIPNSQGQVELSSYSPQISIPAQTVTLSANGNTATVSLVNSANPTLQGPFVSAYAGGAPTGSNYPSSSLTYYFEVLGPSSLSVQLNASGIIGAGQSTSGDSAYSFFEVYNYPGFQKISTVAACGFVSNCTGYNPAPATNNQIFTPGTVGFVGSAAFGMDVANYSIDFNVDSNSLYEILIGANAETSAGVGGAFVDPYLTISNTFSLSNPGYSLVFSPGIMNGFASGVPEPATWATMLMGFVTVGGALRRRRSIIVSLS